MLMGLYAPDIFAKAGAGGAEISAEERSQIEAVITQRLAARAAKNFAESDRLRDHLLAKGIVLKDNKDGTTTWEHKG
jgi:cysteinyl-tRNA synthetase